MASGPRTAVLALMLLVVACSSGSDDGSPSGGSTSSTVTTAPTSTTSDQSPTETTSDPSEPAVDPEQLAAELQALVDRYDLAVAAILADPRVAADREHEAVRVYLSLFVPESGFATGALSAWAETSDRRYRPGPRGRMFESTVSDVALGDEGEEATFRVCLLRSIEIVDAEGRPVSGEGGWNAADGVAVLVDGDWLLRDLTQVSPEECDQEGGGS